MTDTANTESIKDLQDLMQAYVSSHRLPDGAVIVPHNYKLTTTEEFEAHNKRLRGRFDTSLIADFANYYARNVEPEKLAHSPIFVETQPLNAVAALDWMVDNDQPGHMEHTAACHPTALPDWLALRRAHGAELSQEKMVDALEDYTALITAYDDAGQGLSTSQLITAFRNAKITKQSEHAQTLNDSSVERSAMETIDANAARRAPARLTFQLVPFEGFSTRSITARVIIRARGDVPVFNLRIVALEALEHEIALEFVGLVEKAISAFFSENEPPPLYVGKLSY